MAFPASQQTQADALAMAGRTAANLRAQSVQARAFLAANTVSANYVEQIMSEMRDAIAALDRIATVPGIADYARAQYADSGLDIAAEFTAMRQAAVDVRDLIIAALPKDAGGWLLLRQIEADGSITTRQFTPAQTAGLRAALDDLIATVA